MGAMGVADETHRAHGALLRNTALAPMTQHRTIQSSVRGGDDMFEKFSRSWELVKASAAVLKLDKELMLFPVLSGAATCCFRG
jgi:hypothetical protein